MKFLFIYLGLNPRRDSIAFDDIDALYNGDFSELTELFNAERLENNGYADILTVRNGYQSQAGKFVRTNYNVIDDLENKNFCALARDMRGYNRDGTQNQYAFTRGDWSDSFVQQAYAGDAMKRENASQKNYDDIV
jgi:hypothetical protein